MNDLSFLPMDLKKRNSYRRNLFVTAALLFLTGILAAVLFFRPYNRMKMVEKEAALVKSTAARMHIANKAAPTDKNNAALLLSEKRKTIAESVQYLYDAETDSKAEAASQSQLTMTDISYAERGFSVQGCSTDYFSIVGFVRRLEGAALFQKVSLSKIESIDKGYIFSVVIKLKD